MTSHPGRTTAREFAPLLDQKRIEVRRVDDSIQYLIIVALIRRRQWRREKGRADSESGRTIRAAGSAFSSIAEETDFREMNAGRSRRMRTPAAAVMGGRAVRPGCGPRRT